MNGKININGAFFGLKNPERGRGGRISGRNVQDRHRRSASARAKLEVFMARGRKAIPDELKVLRGTDQPCRMSGKTDTVEKVRTSGR